MKLWRLGVLAAMAAFATVASAQTGKIKIVFPTTATTMLLPHYVAQDLGWFKKAGLEVEEITVQGDANAIRAIASGQAELAASGAFPIFGAIINGAPIKAVGSWQPIADYQVVAQSRFNSIKDIESGTIAAASIGGLTTAIPSLLMRKHGLDPNKMKFTSVGGHEARLQAVLAKKLDATIVSNLFASMGQKLGDVKVLASIAKEFPGLGYAYLIATDATLADAAKRARIETYLRHGIVEGARFVVKNPAEAAKIMKGRAPEIDSAIIEGAIKSLIDDKVFGINGGLEAAVLEFTIKIALDTGQLKGALTAEQVADRRVVERVLSQAGTM